MKTIEKIVKEELEKIVLEGNRYNLQDEEELFEFMWLKPSKTGIPVDLFIDDGGSFQRNSHPILLFARNGFSKTINDFISITISKTPKVISDNEIAIGNPILNAIFYFIKSNEKSLRKIALGKISHSEFLETIKVPSLAISESTSKIISEMSTLRKNVSGLPTDIWLDEGGLYRRHAPRIKFKASNDQHTTREYSSMTIEDEPCIENFPKKSNLSSEDVEKIKLFVKTNKQLLLDLCDSKIDYESEFLPNFKKV